MSPQKKSSKPVDSSAGRKVRGLALGLAVIECLLDKKSPCGVSQVAETLQIAVSSAHDVLRALMELGFVEKETQTHLYRLSSGAFGLVHKISEQFGLNPKMGRLLPSIANRNNTSVYIHTLDDKEAVLIGMVGKYGPSTSLGTRVPVYASSAGTILVAQWPENHWNEFLPTPDFPKPTRFTNINPAQFVDELRVARDSGMAVSERTASDDLCSIATAIPHGSPPLRYSVAFVYPCSEWKTINLPDVRKELLRSATEIARVC